MGRSKHSAEDAKWYIPKIARDYIAKIRSGNEKKTEQIRKETGIDGKKRK